MWCTVEGIKQQFRRPPRFGAPSKESNNRIKPNCVHRPVYFTVYSKIELCLFVVAGKFVYSNCSKIELCLFVVAGKRLKVFISLFKLFSAQFSIICSYLVCSNFLG
ncbi:hypothetical protein Dimus_010291 [Dionaea muscipula]